MVTGMTYTVKASEFAASWIEVLELALSRPHLALYSEDAVTLPLSYEA